MNGVAPPTPRRSSLVGQLEPDRVDLGHRLAPHQGHQRPWQPHRRPGHGLPARRAATVAGGWSSRPTWSHSSAPARRSINGHLAGPPVQPVAAQQLGTNLKRLTLIKRNGECCLGVWTAGVPEMLSPEELAAVNATCGRTRRPSRAGGRLDQIRMLRRSPQLGKVAEVAAFLASNKAASITGTFVNVTSGTFPQLAGQFRPGRGRRCSWPDPGQGLDAGRALGTRLVGPDVQGSARFGGWW
jgi:hypothetical protein